jgi:hypothetical protein
MKKKEAPADLITLAEAAELRGYSDSSAINQLIRRGHINRYEMYGKPLVSRSEVLAYQQGKPGPVPESSKKKGGKK